MCNHGWEDCVLNPSRTVPVVHMKELAAPTKVDPRGGSGEPRRKRPRRGACFASNDGSCKSLSMSVPTALGITVGNLARVAQGKGLAGVKRHLNRWVFN